MKKNHRVPLYASFSCLFGLCVALGSRVAFSGDIKAKNSENFLMPASPGDVLRFTFAAVLAFLVLSFADRLTDRTPRLCSRSAVDVLRLSVAAFCCLIASWLPYLLSLSPGNVLDDSLDSIRQMLLHGHPTSSHHPIFYTLGVGVFMKAGEVLFHSRNAGIQLYTVFQAAFLAACIVLQLAFLLHRGIPLPCLLPPLLYFMFLPVFPVYAATMWKDIFYSCGLLLLSMLLCCSADGHLLGRAGTCGFVLCGTLVMATRNNGVYVFAAAIPAALPLMPGKRRLAAAAAATLALFLALTGACKRLWNIQDDFLESIGIPLQQLAYTLNHGGEFSGEDEAYLLELCPRDVWQYAYRPCLVDPLKWNPQFDWEMLSHTKGEFLRVWLRGLIRNPLPYTRAYLLATFGFWAPHVQHTYGYAWIELHENSFGLTLTDRMRQWFDSGFRNGIMNRMIYIGSGTLLWLVLLGFVLTLARSTGLAAAFLPALLNFVTVMIATPAAFSLRYVFIFALGLPLYLALPLLCRKGEPT